MIKKIKDYFNAKDVDNQLGAGCLLSVLRIGVALMVATILLIFLIVWIAGKITGEGIL